MSGGEWRARRLRSTAAHGAAALEVAALCILVRLELAVFPVSRALGPRVALPSDRPPESDLIAARLGTLVDACLRRRPLRSRCLVRALVLRRMLRRRGIPCQLVITAHPGGESLAAHAEARVPGPHEVASSLQLTVRR
jgi:hypothetical protein